MLAAWQSDSVVHYSLVQTYYPCLKMMMRRQRIHCRGVSHKSRKNTIKQTRFRFKASKRTNVEEYGEYRAVRAREAWSRKDGLDFDLRDGTGRFSSLGDSVGEELVDDEGTPSCLGCSALALIPKVAMSSTNEGSVVISRLKGTRRFMHTAGEASGLHS